MSVKTVGNLQNKKQCCLADIKTPGSEKKIANFYYQSSVWRFWLCVRHSHKGALFLSLCWREIYFNAVCPCCEASVFRCLATLLQFSEPFVDDLLKIRRRTFFCDLTSNDYIHRRYGDTVKDLTRVTGVQCPAEIIWLQIVVLSSHLADQRSEYTDRLN